MHPDNDLATIATFYRRVQWTALALGVRRACRRSTATAWRRALAARAPPALAL